MFAHFTILFIVVRALLAELELCLLLSVFGSVPTNILILCKLLATIVAIGLPVIFDHLLGSERLEPVLTNYQAVNLLSYCRSS